MYRASIALVAALPLLVGATCSSAPAGSEGQATIPLEETRSEAVPEAAIAEPPAPPAPDPGRPLDPAELVPFFVALESAS